MPKLLTYCTVLRFSLANMKLKRRCSLPSREPREKLQSGQQTACVWHFTAMKTWAKLLQGVNATWDLFLLSRSCRSRRVHWLKWATGVCRGDCACAQGCCAGEGRAGAGRGCPEGRAPVPRRGAMSHHGPASARAPQLPPRRLAFRNAAQSFLWLRYGSLQRG